MEDEERLVRLQANEILLTQMLGWIMAADPRFGPDLLEQLEAVSPYPDPGLRDPQRGLRVSEAAHARVRAYIRERLP